MQDLLNKQITNQIVDDILSTLYSLPEVANKIGSLQEETVFSLRQLLGQTVVYHLGIVQNSINQILVSAKLPSYFVDFIPWYRDPLRAMRFICYVFGIRHIRIKATSFSEAFMKARLRGLV